MSLEMNNMGSLPGDNAFRRESLKGTQWEPTYAGALSFMRRKYTRDLTGVEMRRPRHMSLRHQHHPTGHAAGRVDGSHVPQLIFEDGLVGGGS